MGALGDAVLTPAEINRDIECRVDLRHARSRERTPSNATPPPSARPLFAPPYSPRRHESTAVDFIAPGRIAVEFSDDVKAEPT